MNDTRTEPLMKFTKQSKARMLKLNKEFAESIADSTFFSRRSMKKLLKAMQDLNEALDPEKK